MRVSKSKVTLLSLAVAGLFAASAAQAIVDLNAATGATKFASEINFTGATTLATAGNPAQVKLGFGVSAGQDRYVRFDLPAGVKWGAAITPAALTDFTTPLAIPPANVALSQGGTTADSYVVLQITAASGGIAVSDTLQFVVPSVTVTSATTVTLSYSLHETAISAATPVASNTTRLSGQTTAPLLTFTPAINVVASPVAPETIAATATLFKFCSGLLGAPGTANCAAGATDLTAVVGGIATYTWNTGPIFGAGVAPVDLTLNTVDFTPVLTSVAVVATGDFGATTGVGLSVAPTLGGLACPAAVAGTTFTATTATYNPGITLLPAATTATLCATVNGTAALPAQSFTGSWVPTYTAAYAGGPRPLGTIGQWVRDGAELQSPWFSFGGTRYISRFFFMNTGATPATCTSTALAETGNVLTAGSAATTGFTIPANGQVAVLATDVVSAATVAGRAAVRFVCLAPGINIQGRYVITDTTSGSLDSGQLMRPGTN